MTQSTHPAPSRATARHAAPPWRGVALLLLLAGCAGVGPQRLDMDQLGYATALGEGLKRQMLLNMVRLRYADVPAFLSVSQVISGYTLQGTAQAGLNAYPQAGPGNFATVAGTLQYTTRPTFTFTPVTGQEFAQSYLRPLVPAELLSLAQSGAPIDVLFRLGVQAVNGLTNNATRGGAARQASTGFQELMQALRALQSAGSLSLRFERNGAGGRVFLVFDQGAAPALPAVQETRRLLGADPEARELEVVYGRSRPEPGQVAVLTRSVLQVLYELGAQIEVAEADIRGGETLANAPGPAAATERLIRVRQGVRPPAEAYAAVEYRGRAYWIEAGDYPSKSVFTFAYILQVLAESGSARAAPLVTIPGQ